MPRTVPSQIDQYLKSRLSNPDDGFSAAILEPHSGTLAGLLELYDSLSTDLINLPEDQYADLVAGISTIRIGVKRFEITGLADAFIPITRVLPTVWKLIRLLPDSFPSQQHDLAFIADAVLRDIIAKDANAVSIGIQSGEWKGATVLAGSCIEALLLYALGEIERKTPGSVKAAVAALSWPKGAPNNSDFVHSSWNLWSYARVTHRLGLISDETNAELDTARDYRNLIHPARSIREKIIPDRGTAYISAGAMEHVIRDLRTSL